ncbi:MAG: alpha/beta hydrolase-fold protein [Bacteroidota bacterium]
MNAPNSIARILLLVCLIFVSSESIAQRDKDQSFSLEHGGRERTFFLHLPADYSPNSTYPLVIALHGGGGKAKLFNRSTRRRFNELADIEKFIVVYPQGVKKSWNDNSKRDTLGYARRWKVDDVGFIRKMIDQLEAEYSIDPSHIFACGISNGGLMSLTLAVELPEKIKAIGMVASNFSEAQSMEMDASSKFSMIMIHGDQDRIFPYEEGEIKVFRKTRGKVLGVQKSIELLCEINGNNPNGVGRELPDPSANDGCTAEQIVYPNTNDPSLKIELIRVKGGGHTWPGGTQYLPKSMVGRVSRDFNACDALWTFFESLI